MKQHTKYKFTTFSLLTDVCKDTFDEVENRHGFGGTQEVGVNAEADCRTACLSKVFEECGAYDFNTLANTCWIHQTAPEPSIIGTAIGITHYTRVQCTTG